MRPKYPGKMSSETTIMKVNIKAVRDFINRYKNIAGERWFTTGEGYVANFLLNNVDTRIVYDYRGVWLYNLLTYTEDHLPFAVRDMVKREYYDFDIVFTREFQLKDGPVYMISLRNENIRKTVRVCNGEMETGEETTD